MDFDADLFRASMAKAFGEEALIDLSAKPTIGSPGTIIPSTSLELNNVLGVGGLPRGRIIEIFGKPSAGKTALANDFAVNAQRLFPNLPVFWIDAEEAFDPDYAQSCGLDVAPNRFYIAQTNVAEESLDMMAEASKAGASLVVMDSVGALKLRRNLEGGTTTDGQVGGIAKCMHNHLRAATHIIANSKTTLLYLNHITYKPGVMYGSPETTPGGEGLPFYASIRLKISRKENIMGKEGFPVGIVSTIEGKKNKVGPPFRKCEVSIIFGKGLDGEDSLITSAVEKGIILKKGGWLYYKEGKWNGRDNLKAALTSSTDLRDSLKKELEA